MVLDWRRNSFRFRGLVLYGRIYNDRIGELIAENGAPEWSPSTDCVTDDDLVALLTSDVFNEVPAFPHDLVARVSLVRSDDGSIRINRDDSELIELREMFIAESRTMPPDGAFYFGRVPDYPGVTFLRRGIGWIAAYRGNGQLIAVAYKPFPPEPPQHFQGK